MSAADGAFGSEYLVFNAQNVQRSQKQRRGLMRVHMIGSLQKVSAGGGAVISWLATRWRRCALPAR